MNEQFLSVLDKFLDAYHWEHVTHSPYWVSMSIQYYRDLIELRDKLRGEQAVQ